MTINCKSANGATGFIIHGMDGGVYFRMYNDDGSFIDYDYLHSDMQVTINDSDAFFYTIGGKNKVDHAPDTLGITNKVVIEQ